MPANALSARPTGAAPEDVPEDVHDTLQALRAEIDALDGQMLDILERRLEIARRIGRSKPAAAPGEKGSAFRADREQAVVRRLVERAPASLRPLVLGVWREIMGAGLAAQGELNVVVWTGAGGRIGVDAARRRFGASAQYAAAYTAEEALDAADARGALAVLALAPDAPWWAELAERRPDLWVCEGLAVRPGAEPEALAVARVPPSTLAAGQVFRVAGSGGDADWTRAPMRTLAVHGALRLQCGDADEAGELSAADRERGVIGRAPRPL